MTTQLTAPNYTTPNRVARGNGFGQSLWQRAFWADASPRLCCLRLILIGGCLVGLLATTPLWLSSRAVPLLPIASWFPHVTARWDKAVFVLLVFSLCLACRFYRPAILCHLAVMLFLYFTDQNRGQPWVYLYWVMLLLTLLPEPVAIAACRVVLSGVYIWAGIQKCNPLFFQSVPAFFAKPALDWGVSLELVRTFEVLVACAPLAEVFIGLGIWCRRLRSLSLVLAALVHLTALVCLGPAGHNYNASVWPWNLAMLALVLTLAGDGRMKEAWTALRRSRLAVAIVSLVCLLPVLSFFGRWDSYFSFSLYSANLATADICMSQAGRDRLPPGLQEHVHRVVHPYHPAWQGPFVFDYQGWSMAELGVPALPEPRNFATLYRFLHSHVAKDAELRMVLMHRGGLITFHEGQTTRVILAGSPSATPQPTN